MVSGNISTSTRIVRLAFDVTGVEQESAALETLFKLAQQTATAILTVSAASRALQATTLLGAITPAGLAIAGGLAIAATLPSLFQSATEKDNYRV